MSLLSAAIDAAKRTAGGLRALGSDVLPNGVKPTRRLVGVVDRDTFDDAEVQGEQGRLPGLVVTEGWALEGSLLIQDATRIDSLEGERIAWVQAGALG